MLLADSFAPVGPDTRPWSNLPRAEQAALRAAFDGIPPVTINALMRHSGFRTPDAVRRAADSELLAIDNLGPVSLAALRARFPRITPGDEPIVLLVEEDGRLATCGACETIYTLDRGHGSHDCIRALLRRIKSLEDHRAA